MARRLPDLRPCPRYGHYQLPCGSRIYRSGGRSYKVRPGEFFAWVATGEKIVDDKLVPTGEILLSTGGIRYFRSHKDAYNAIMDRREKLGI